MVDAPSVGTFDRKYWFRHLQGNFHPTIVKTFKIRKITNV